MAAYEFLTTWCVDAPIDRVYEAIHESKEWPRWWKGVESADELEPGDDDGLGSLVRYVWKSRLPYRLEFEARITRVERPYLLEAEAVGELTGVGRWRLWDGHGTAATYEWKVDTTRPWMNALAPIARPVFAWNHHVVMRQGAEGLAGLLGARLLARS